MTEAEKWAADHSELPDMTECEAMGARDGYDDLERLVITFADGSELSEDDL